MNAIGLLIKHNAHFFLGGPENLSVSIEPATVLPNGTLTITRGSTVSFTCSADSYPYQQLTWSFNGLVYSNSSLANNTGSTLEYRIEGIQPNAQGNYTCRAHNNISHEEVNKSTEVLVYCEYHDEIIFLPWLVYLWNTFGTHYEH